MQIVAPFGFYGSGNIGDEATLNGFASLLLRTGTQVQVSVGSRNPAHTARVEPAFRYFKPSGNDPRRWLAKLRASAHVIIGGTPIMDVLGDWPLCELTPLVRSIDRWKVPLVFIGVGIEDLRLEESRRIVANEIVPRVRHWSVRSDRDRQRLIECGVLSNMITVAADMAWLIEPATNDFGIEHLQRLGVGPAERLIGVNLVNENSVFDKQPGIVESLAATLDKLTEEMDARVIFLANEVREGPTFDKSAALRIVGRMARPDRAVLAPNDYLAPRQMMSIIDCCALTVSMRYHFCLFSALQEVPFIAIERSDKVADLCWDLGWQARVESRQFNPSEVIEHGTRLAHSGSAVEGQLAQRVQNMKERALGNVASLNVLGNRQVLAIGEHSPVAAE
jgi:polysaccharide pyruvyl transferase WcaK-like protein